MTFFYVFFKHHKNRELQIKYLKFKIMLDVYLYLQVGLFSFVKKLLIWLLL